ncbi:MAG: cob(I)yrinic acid a,c-diamide adenosyltransferase [Rickettsiales bacterium]|jgi:cob(I)alamin adenosyltransferase|nr:cob(I)yrinic acid a,c-diamide adenosyltransferase [Rickettsiales bacterium]
MVKLNKIYTRTGDGGDTGLVDGSRRPKSDLRFEAMGDVDEANSMIGLARLHTAPASLTPHFHVYDDMLARIQQDLFDLGADLATPMADGEDKALRIIEKQVRRLESEIDQLNEYLEPLNSFVLPGGTELSARLHLARTVTRRAERVACALAERERINPLALQYINRLSDFLFVLARAANDNGRADVLWKPGINR